MKLKAMLLVSSMVMLLASQSVAGGFDVGARYGRTVEKSGNTAELAVRYFPLPLSVISVGASLGYADITYNKGWYRKKAHTMPLGGYLNAHLPMVPFVKPYAGIGGIYYSINNNSSSNPADRGKERSGTMTAQGGIDFSLPMPLLSLNLEVRRLISDKQTQVLGGVWLRF